MTEHTLHREVVETRVYEVRIIDGELVSHFGDGGHFVDSDEKATIECTCGDRFRKDSTAIAHLNKCSDE